MFFKASFAAPCEHILSTLFSVESGTSAMTTSFIAGVSAFLFSIKGMHSRRSKTVHTDKLSTQSTQHLQIQLTSAGGPYGRRLSALQTSRQRHYFPGTADALNSGPRYPADLVYPANTKMTTILNRRNGLVALPARFRLRGSLSEFDFTSRNSDQDVGNTCFLT